MVTEARVTLRDLLSMVFIGHLKKENKDFYEFLQRFTLDGEERLDTTGC